MEIEKETILLMSKGDKKAYETMFRRFYPKVHRFVAMLLKNEDDADDVSQLIFLKVWNKTREVCRYPELRFLPLYFGKIYCHQLYFLQAHHPNRY